MSKISKLKFAAKFTIRTITNDIRFFHNNNNYLTSTFRILSKRRSKMASVNELMIDFVQFEDDIKRKECVAEATRYLYFIAARRIQVNEACSR